MLTLANVFGKAKNRPAETQVKGIVCKFKCKYGDLYTYIIRMWAKSKVVNVKVGRTQTRNSTYDRLVYNTDTFIYIPKKLYMIYNLTMYRYYNGVL